MNFRATQPNFSRGELAPQLHGRFDADVWQASLREALNVHVLKYGGVAKRPGLEYVSEVLDASEPNRLIPFQFSTSQTYALEFGQGYMAPCAFGGRVLEDHLAITNITNAANAQVTAAYHGYSVGDPVWLTGVVGGMSLLNNRIWRVVTVIDDNNFTIDADTTDMSAFTSALGGTTRSAAPPPDPAPPTVPPVVSDPAPPDTGGGGGGGDWEYRP